MTLAYLTGSVTQGSADAFAQGEIATALTGVGNFAYRVRELLFELPNAAVIAAATDQIEVALSRRSKSAMPVITDRDVIAKIAFGRQFTTSGDSVTETVRRLTFSEDDELLIVEDPIYLLCDSAATALSSTFYCRIGYERVSISAVDRLTLLTQSLGE